MSFEIVGKLHKKFDAENKTATFQAREFVIEASSGNYPQMIKFQLTQDRCGLIDPFEEGNDIKVYFDLRGREWNGKYFTNLNAWRLEAPDATSSAPQNNDSSNDNPSITDNSFPTANDEPAVSGTADLEDDLPF